MPKKIMEVANLQFSPAQIRVVNQILDSDQSTAEQAEALILLVGRTEFEQLLDRGVFPETETRQLQAVAQILQYHDRLPIPEARLIGVLPGTMYVKGATHLWKSGVVTDLFNGSQYHTIWAPPVAWPLSTQA